jgi:1,4-alpha-glucan branching enzyme
MLRWMLMGSLFFPCQIVLDSDDGLFGGFSRLDHDAEYFTAVSPGSEYCGSLGSEYCSTQSASLILLPPYNILVDNDPFTDFLLQDWPHDNRPCSFSVYAPSRTAVVYAPAGAEDE